MLWLNWLSHIKLSWDFQKSKNPELLQRAPNLKQEIKWHSRQRVLRTDVYEQYGVCESPLQMRGGQDSSMNQKQASTIFLLKVSDLQFNSEPSPLNSIRLWERRNKTGSGVSDQSS